MSKQQAGGAGAEVRAWTEDDVKAGMYICKPPAISTGWRVKHTYQVGFFVGRNRSCLIAISDGMVSLRDESRKTIAEWLTKNGMILADSEWLEQCLIYLGRLDPCAYTSPDAAQAAAELSGDPSAEVDVLRLRIAELEAKLLEAELDCGETTGRNLELEAENARKQEYISDHVHCFIDSAEIEKLLSYEEWKEL